MCAIQTFNETKQFKHVLLEENCLFCLFVLVSPGCSEWKQQIVGWIVIIKKGKLLQQSMENEHLHGNTSVKSSRSVCKKTDPCVNIHAAINRSICQLKNQETKVKLNKNSDKKKNKKHIKLEEYINVLLLEERRGTNKSFKNEQVRTMKTTLLYAIFILVSSIRLTIGIQIRVQIKHKHKQLK